ncbi:MAG TPA: hypothetical protein VFZ21_21965 [Gemmatimonadaceae bacterium]|nr:hypothetical protein [Gemmatimonadaceae bacterium]
MPPRLLVVASIVSLLPLWSLTAQQGRGSDDLLPRDPGRLTLRNVEATRGQYRGRDAIRLVPTGAGETIAILSDLEFRDGTIEVDVAGVPRAGADSGARGFVGIAFRVDQSGDRYAAFYLRPTNGRANDQLRRNHSTQYIVHPDHPWYRLRKEAPGVYESYVDLEPGVWTSMRVEVRQGVARLYVDGSAQPVLIVNDMKNPPASGRIALWIGAGTEAHFSRLRVTPAR